MADDGYLGQPPTTGTGDFNADSANILRILARVETAALVRVVACTNDGGLAPIGTVDVQPLVHQVDGYGKATPHGTIYGLPYLRMQGGSSAVILDPVAGDLGVAVFASRDTSAARSSLAPALPGSGRRHDPADGTYIGLCLGGAATQYLQFLANSLNIVSPGTITLTVGQSSIVISASGVAINSPSLTHNGKNIGNTHVHPDVATGNGTTGQPE